MNKTISPGALSGRFRAPASKSHAHRLLICAALGKEAVTISCGTFSDDILATIDCLNAMGAGISRRENLISVDPINPHAQKDAPCQLPCRESGSTLRFLLPVLGALGLSGTFHMEGRLPQRPLAPLDEVLRAHGMNIELSGSLLHVSGQLRPGAYTLPGNVSSQYLSGLLFALPLLDGESELQITGELQSENYLAMTEQAVLQSGIRFQKRDACFNIPGMQEYHLPDGLMAEGDWSGASFFLCAGALSERGVLAQGLNISSAQPDRAVLDILRRFGAEVQPHEDSIFVRRKALSGITIDAGAIPDLVPALAAVAAFANGTTTIQNAARLRLKESDRLQTVAGVLSSLGGDVAELSDGLVIRGRPELSGGTADSFGDHRIAMLAAILACGCRAPVDILDTQCTAKSYPNFWQTLAALKGDTP